MSHEGYEEALHRVTKAAEDRSDGLSLSGLGLRSLPPELFLCHNLRTLILSRNRLEAIPDDISQLSKLEHLSLEENDINLITNVLEKLSALKGLYLHNNPRLGVPVELLGPTHHQVMYENRRPADPVDILEYTKRINANGRPLNEAKLILVGKGAVGKTSLVEKLKYGTFEPGKTKTEGISIERWELPIKGENILLNVWDFGGQEIMHATHQFFLTERSLYLLVLNGRDGSEDIEAEYWLKLIASFGGNSQVIIVLNKIKEFAFDLNRSALLEKYPNIRAFVRTDCEDNTGIQELKETIANVAGTLEELRVKFPGEWFSIKDELATTERNYLSFENYRQLCVKHGVSSPRYQDLLAKYLNQLGIVLNYSDDPRLKDSNILNPHWVTRGIYKILNSRLLEENKGEVRLEEISGILPESEYPAFMCRFVFDLMKKFDLCFSFPDDDAHYLIPELLPKKQPGEVKEFDLAECLNFQYHYRVLPEGILPRFIARTHYLSQANPRWRSGVILQFENCRALVWADNAERKVSISIKGENPENRRRLLAVIRTDFDQIHREIKNLDPREMVPIPGHMDNLIPYRDLLVMEENGMKEFKNVVGAEVKTFSVADLLRGVDLSKQTRESAGRPELDVFFIFSHQDEAYKKQLETHLKILHRQKLIRAWSDREITPGEKWGDEIDPRLEKAEIILILVSPDLLASDYCYDIEMKRAMERYKSGDAALFPIIVRESNWHSAPFGKVQALPRDAKSVSTWTNKDAAWASVSQGIENAAMKLLSGAPEIRKIDLHLQISRVSLKNIRCFEEFDLSFENKNNISNFVLLFGDNGIGKSSLLKSVALGLCDINTALGLNGMHPISLLKNNTEQGEIIIELKSPQTNEKWTLKTTIKKLDDGNIMMTQEPSDVPRDRIFVCGYGAARHSMKSRKPVEEFSFRDSLLTLFDYDESLLDPELVLLRMKNQKVDIGNFLKKIDSVLGLEPNSTTLDDGIRVSGPWGDFMPLESLGDGFQTTLGWIMDMFGWALMHSPESFDHNISGIVIIDELEQHLHPSWQREIIKYLSGQFPKIQFLASSHSPMCALGLTALTEEKTKLIKLSQTEEAVEAIITQKPENKRADQVLTSSLFGLFSASSFNVSANIEKFTKLSAKKVNEKTLSNAEQKELSELDEKLMDVFQPYRNELERKVDEKVKAALHEEFAEKIRSGELNKKAIDLSIRERLETLLGEEN
ncbi:MAG TPA: COR domain-containing protein [Pyrinomonadaceae bacterium]|jgi:internalin A|nr:COR domain-containing protein [Pyrinomonadaceae bacterium]